MNLNSNNSNNGAVKDEGIAFTRKDIVTSLYRYSDLSIKNIAQEVSMPLNEAQWIIDRLSNPDAARLFVEESTTKIEKIMSTNVVSLDISKPAANAAALMTERKVGSIIVTKDNIPFGIVTERDLVRRYFRDTLLESLASRPLITAMPTTTVNKAADIMLKNRVRKLPIVDEKNKLLTGIITVTDLGRFLLPTRRPGLTLSVLQAISRGKGPRCDSCNSETEIQWCDSCNRFMCMTCENAIHSIDLP
ncbi:MAG TPA: CBS domain-containing protein [Nitrososphaeraceae archaeon]|jgi:CBS domain-containing protein